MPQSPKTDTVFQGYDQHWFFIESTQMYMVLLHLTFYFGFASALNCPPRILTDA